jgi:hypothetical protein
VQAIIAMGIGLTVIGYLLIRRLLRRRHDFNLLIGIATTALLLTIWWSLSQPACRQGSLLQRATSLPHLSCPAGVNGSRSWIAHCPLDAGIIRAAKADLYFASWWEVEGWDEVQFTSCALRYVLGIRLWLLVYDNMIPPFWQRCWLAGPRCDVGRHRPASQTALPIAAPGVHPTGRRTNGSRRLTRRSLAPHCSD